MRKLVNERQVFGEVHDSNMHPSTLKSSMGQSNANLGRETMNGNNGVTRVESFADKNPGAESYACRNRDNPFAFVGKSFGDSKSSLSVAGEYGYGN